MTTIAETKPTIHPNLSAPYLGDQMSQLDHALSQTTPSNGDDMSTIYMTASEFIKRFANNGADAIDYIIACNEKGLVEVSENTLPTYTFINGRFISYDDWHPQTHSFDVRIERWYEDDDGLTADAVVRFDYVEGIDLYWNHLHHALDGVTEPSEMHWQDNIETHHRRERDTLALQTMINDRRLNRTRRYLIEKGASITPNEFEQHCVRVAEMREENERALKRIDQLEY